MPCLRQKLIKSIPWLRQKMIKSIPCLRQKSRKTYPAGRTSPLSPYKGVPPPGIRMWNIVPQVSELSFEAFSQKYTSFALICDNFK